jgi:ribose 5-phosphate isomerase B
MQIYVATDHAGFALKEKIVEHVRDVLGYEVIDFGAHELVVGDDYPEYIRQAGSAVSESPHNTKAIIFGGSGQGEAIVANRFQNVRAIVYYGGNLEIIRLSREHNDAKCTFLWCTIYQCRRCAGGSCTLALDAVSRRGAPRATYCTD